MTSTPTLLRPTEAHLWLLPWSAWTREQLRRGLNECEQNTNLDKSWASLKREIQTELAARP
jgi:hypothetical protein